jgi:hypothetical protein
MLPVSSTFGFEEVVGRTTSVLIAKTHSVIVSVVMARIYEKSLLRNEYMMKEKRNFYLQKRVYHIFQKCAIWMLFFVLQERKNSYSRKNIDVTFSV